MNGVSGLGVFSPKEGGEWTSACLNVMSVGAGEGSGGGIVFDRVNDRSRLDGRFLLTELDELRGRTGTGSVCTAFGCIWGDVTARLEESVALVRSSRCDPLDPAATTSIASSSLDSAQSALESFCALEDSAVR